MRGPQPFSIPHTLSSLPATTVTKWRNDESKCSCIGREEQRPIPLVHLCRRRRLANMNGSELSKLKKRLSNRRAVRRRNSGSRRCSSSRRSASSPCHPPRLSSRRCRHTSHPKCLLYARALYTLLVFNRPCRSLRAWRALSLVAQQKEASLRQRLSELSDAFSSPHPLERPCLTGEGRDAERCRQADG